MTTMFHGLGTRKRASRSARTKIIPLHGIVAARGAHHPNRMMQGAEGWTNLVGEED
jgi:hypothetical protein